MAVDSKSTPADSLDISYAQIALTLAQDYFTIYYVNTDTDQFVEYSSNSEYQKLNIEQSGEDFFTLSAKNIRRLIYPEDMERVLYGMKKENIMQEINSHGRFSMTYRLMFDGIPVYVNLKAMRLSGTVSNHIIIGVSNVDSQIRREQELERAHQESLTYSRIAHALSQDFYGIYYVDVHSDNFTEYSTQGREHTLKVVREGTDFFGECAKDIQRLVYEPDRNIAMASFRKENLLHALKDGKTFSINYRLLFGSTPSYVHLKAMYLDENHIVVGIRNIDEQMKLQHEYEKTKQRQLSYSRIAQALASDFYEIYYVNLDNEEYIQYSAQGEDRGHSIDVEERGIRFFEFISNRVLSNVYKHDQHIAASVLNRDFLLSVFDNNEKEFSATYRRMIDGRPTYVLLKVLRLDEEDTHHVVIGIRDVDAQVQKEIENAKALNAAQKTANQDALTGVKSKYAYVEKEKAVNSDICANRAAPFAVAVCDVNGLKWINDNLGHQFGDQYLKDAASLICSVFKHSPVFRIGGDEFAVLLQGHDYDQRADLETQLKTQVLTNQKENGVVVAVGHSDFEANRDHDVASVFERADAIMYQNKLHLKGKQSASAVKPTLSA